jgi:hypothetical protein
VIPVRYGQTYRVENCDGYTVVIGVYEHYKRQYRKYRRTDTASSFRIDRTSEPFDCFMNDPPMLGMLSVSRLIEVKQELTALSQ